ncbi:MAG: TonB-dependent receptor [Acidobacteriia bacterium]|nr:TonB-dependent receptor [Terriglobia bacterium]
MLRPSQNTVVTLARRSLMIALVAAAIACITCAPLLAQVTSGTIFGSVKDPTGAMIKDASVTIANPANGITRTVTTGSDGTFVAPGLYPGTYTITVESKGFKKSETTGVVLSAADKLNAGEIVLAMGAATESVTVTADAGQIQLQSNSGERSDLISSKQLNDVAMNGRNVLDYLKLVPGMSGTFDGHASGTGGIDSYNINGTRANQHEFTIDGASNMDTGNNGGTHVTINTDAIEEVKILTSNYQAEFGKAAGGQVALTTKSGSNQFHGNGRLFHRHEGLNANEWFNKKTQLSNDQPNTPGLYRYNYVGYQIGGPIKKDKLFFFWSQEFYRQFVPGGTTQFYTPTELERQGDFSQSVIPGADGNPVPVVIAGPNIANNKIVTDGMTADQLKVFQNVQKILNLYPLPNATGFGSAGQGYNFSGTFSAHTPRREDILRVDYQLNDKNRLYGRWIHNSENDVSPFTPFPGPFGIFACASSIQFTGGCTQKHPGWNFSANLVSTITPTLLNEFSVGPSHTLSLAESVNGNITIGKNGIDMPLLYPVTAVDSIPDMSFNDLPGTNFSGPYLGATPWKQANTTINVNDNLSWVWHNHTLKAGLFYQRNRKDQIAWGNINGQFNFGTGATSGGTCPGETDCQLGDPLASALIGEFQGFSQSTARPLGKFRYNQLEFYVQDTWKITSRLTLDYGMRFAWIPPQYDANNEIALFDPAAYDPANAVTITPGGNIDPEAGGDPLNGMRFTKNGTIPTGGWNSRGIMPEPRLGFAYDLFGSHKTVLRGGVGMMHDRTQGNLIFNPVFNNPALVRTASVAANNIANLPTLAGSFGNGVLGGVVGAARNGKVPTVYSFSFGIQHEIAKDTTLDLAYVGTLSRHLITSRDINAIPYGAAFLRENQDPANFEGGVVPDVEPNLNPIYAAAGLSFSGINAYGRNSYSNAPLVPYKGYDQIAYLQFDGTSNYNSLQASLQRRFSKGLTFGAVYTWSKSLTTASADQDTQNPFNALLDYRAAGWDRTHVFAANYVYDIPGMTKHFAGPKWLSYITDNYQLSGVTQFMTGTPVDTGNGWSFESGALDGSNMWGAIQYYYALDQGKNPILPAVGPPVRGSRDSLRSGGLQNWDMSLFKNIPLGTSERYSIQLRLEAFNAFNHPNFDTKNYGVNVDHFPFQWQPSDSIAISKPSNWGAHTDTYNPGTGSPRVLQLGAKFYF